MKYDAQGNQVEDDDPNAVSDTPPSQPPAPTANNEVMMAYQQQLLAEARKNADLQRQLDEAKKVPPAPPTEAEERQFFDTPKTSTRDIVRAEVQEAVRPLNEFTRNMARQQTYDKLKADMFASPNFPYARQLSDLIDQVMSGVQSPDVQTMITAYNQCLGYYISTGGELVKSAPAPTNAPTNRGTPPVAPLPPHARPSAPPPHAGGNGGTRIRALNENEKKIARFNKWDDKHYLFWTEHVEPNEIAKISDEEVDKRIKELFGA